MCMWGTLLRWRNGMQQLIGNIWCRDVARLTKVWAVLTTVNIRTPVIRVDADCYRWWRLLKYLMFSCRRRVITQDYDYEICVSCSTCTDLLHCGTLRLFLGFSALLLPVFLKHFLLFIVDILFVFAWQKTYKNTNCQSQLKIDASTLTSNNKHTFIMT